VHFPKKLSGSFIVTIKGMLTMPNLYECAAAARYVHTTVPWGMGISSISSAMAHERQHHTPPIHDNTVPD
jgi:hypothetical protein